MKKPAVKILSVILCVLLIVGGTGGAVYAANAPAGSSAPADAAPADSGAESTAPKTATSSYDPNAEANVKDETVYVLAGADGTVQKIIVSDWIQNTLGADSVDDVTGLSNIETVKGNETFTLGGDSSCVWNAKGNDVYYQGNIDRELPVSVSVSYTLDGQPITPEALAGRSGRVVIRFDYANCQYEMVNIGGKQEKIYVPFAMLTGVLLDNDVFRNVSVSNGKLVNDGDRTAVIGLAFPGLQESLALDRDTLELPEYVEIAADVEDFALETTVTLAANGLFNDMADETDGSFSGLDGLDEDLNRLTDAMEQLMDGSSQLYDGLCTLLDSSEELVTGIDQLAAGAAQLKQGAGDLDAGAAQLQAGAAALCQGLNTLSANSGSLNAGAKQVFDTLLATANAQLAAAGLDLPAMTVDNYAGVLNAAIASLDETAVYQQALDQVTAAVEEKRPYIEGQVTAAVEQAVTEQVTAAVEEQVTEQVTAAVREQATAQAVQSAAQMDLESYRAAAAAGLVDEATQTAITSAVDSQMSSEAAQQTIAANVEQQMASEQIQTVIQQNVSAQMDSEAVKEQVTANTQAQVEKAIAENMADETVQGQLQAASEGAKSVIALKASLDSYNAFYLGLNTYTAGVDQAAKGAGELSLGIDTLKTGTASLSTGADQLYDGILTLKDGTPALIDGVTRLRDGAMELSDGLKEFNEQGVQKLMDAFDGDLSGLMDRMDAVSDVSRRYNTFSGISGDMDGQVKFIWRTEAVD